MGGMLDYSLLDLIANFELSNSELKIFTITIIKVFSIFFLPALFHFEEDLTFLLTFLLNGSFYSDALHVTDSSEFCFWL